MRGKIFSIFLTLVLVLSFSLVTAGSALAWEVEDPCVAANEDFVWGIDNEGGVHFGGQCTYREGDGYNLYRDDVTDTGNLDSVTIFTETPDAIDLPTIAEYPTGWYMGDESPDTYYWATEPRGRDFTKAEILQDSGVPGKGLDKAPGLQKPFNPDSKAGEHAGKK